MTTKRVLGVLVFLIMGAIIIWQMYRDMGWKDTFKVLGFTGFLIASCALGAWLIY